MNKKKYTFEDCQKHSTTLDSAYINKILQHIRGTATFSKQSPNDYITLYTEVQSLCDQGDKFCLFFLERYEKILENYVVEDVVPDLKNAIDQGRVLEVLIQQWNHYAMLSFMMKRMFSYLDKFYLRDKKKIGQRAIEYFYKHISQNVKDMMRSEIMNEFTKDRNKDVVDKQMVNSVVRLYVHLGIRDAVPIKTEGTFSWQGKADLEFYKKQFEALFLERTIKEYDQKANVRVAEMTAPDYLKWADECIQHEEEYCDTMLDPSTRQPLMDAVEQELITKRNQQIIDKDTGLVHMVNNQLSDDLRLLYRCFSRREANLTCIVEQMKAYIVETGKTIVEDKENIKDPIKYTTACLNFKDQMDKQISYCFNSDMKFERGRDESFTHFLNETSLPPKHFANYINNYLTKDCVGKSNQDIELVLSQIIRLFCCLHDRDWFIKECEHHYKQRLLSKTVKSNESEEQFLKKIEAESGLNATVNMKKMTKDITLSSDFAPDYYKKTKVTEDAVNLESVQCLTASAWSMEGSEFFPLEKPLQLKKLYESFENHYQQKHSRRQLQYLNNFGKAEIKFLLNSKLIIKASIIQACILSVYNIQQTWTWGEIKMKFKEIPEDVLLHHFKTLYYGNKAIIVKQVKKPAFESDDETLKLNKNFDSASVRVNLVPAPFTKKSKGGEGASREENEAVQKSRGEIIKMKIVKIMKTNQGKNVKMNDICSQVKDMSSNFFIAQPVAVKREIEWLIQNSYMKRDEKIRNEFTYMA